LLFGDSLNVSSKRDVSFWRSLQHSVSLSLCSVRFTCL
jgi:hypothetical protein